MKIAYLIDTIASDTAGTQKQLLETIRRLDGAAFEPQLICLWESDWMRSNSLPCPCTVLGYRGFIKPNFPGVISRLAQLITRQQIDIVQTFFEDSIFVALLGALLARHRTILLSSRRDIGLGTANQPWYHRLYGKILPWANRRFAGIVANSEEVRNYVSRRERTPQSKIKVIYNGVAVTQSPLSAPPAIIARRPNDIWIAIVGSLTPVKRHDLLIHAFASLHHGDSGNAVSLLVLGDGPERLRLGELARTEGVGEHVYFAGAVGNVEQWLQHVNIGVLCSDREGLSNAILEYMVAGLPVVATQVGGNPELVDSNNGFCVPSGNVAALATALRQLIADPGLRERLGQASRTRVLREFSWERTMSETENYYRGLVATHRNATHE